MKGVKEIKGRIRAVDSVAKITLAMQLVSASKMKRSQDFAIGGRPYLLSLAEVIARLPKKKVDKNIHPFFVDRTPVQRRCIIVVGTDRGLCGVLNNNLFRQLSKGEDADGKCSYISVGKKAMQFLSRNGYDLIASFFVNDKVQYHEVQGIGEFVSQKFLAGEIDTVEVLYQRFVNTLKYVPVLQKILPMSDFYEEFSGMLAAAQLDFETPSFDPRPLIFEPSVREIVDHIASIFLKYNLHQVLLEAKASEHSARMVAMKSATDNAEALGQELRLEYNKARQYAITNEIIELAVASGERES
ncbi:MAG: ATP synthase F1 subunit gamma [Opitutales bacterium]|nr:ATP synthase F1 subunit gamma [Opitutales bacterium]